jgi:hypothetical protein
LYRLDISRGLIIVGRCLNAYPGANLRTAMSLPVVIHLSHSLTSLPHASLFDGCLYLLYRHLLYLLVVTDSVIYITSPRSHQPTRARKRRIRVAASNVFQKYPNYCSILLVKVNRAHNGEQERLRRIKTPAGYEKTRVARYIHAGPPLNTLSKIGRIFLRRNCCSTFQIFGSFLCSMALRT